MFAWAGDKMYKFLDKIKLYMNKRHMYLIFIIGVLIILVSGQFKPNKPIENNKIQSNNNAEVVEEKLANILSKISGVGKVDVMITYETSGELIAISNDKVLSEDDKESVDKEIVMKSSGSEKEPFISKEIEPVVRGVLVVAEGAEVGDTRINLTRAVSSVLDVPVNRIEVLPKNKEEKR